MRSGSRSLLLVGLLLAVTLPVASGCSKSVSAPRPLPEGSQNGELLLMGWPEQPSTWFVINDPGTPDTPSDDHVVFVANDFWADSAGVRAATLDASISNQVEVFRYDNAGNAQPMFDFLVQPDVRFIGRGLDLYQVEDFAPTATPRYVERGALDGIVTASSPVSNTAAAAPFKDDMIWSVPSKLAPGDSVLKIRYVDDPATVFDVVQLGPGSAPLGNGSNASFDRRIRGIPNPVLPGLLSLNTFATFLLPAGAGNPGLTIPLTSPRWPLFFYIRVTGIDAQGRIVNRVNTYQINVTIDAGNNLNFYEPTGGAVEIIDPYPDLTHPVPQPVQISRNDAFQALHDFGGGVPHQVAFLSTTAAGIPAPAPVSAAVAQAAAQIQANPLFSVSALRQSIATVRRAMEQAATGAATAGPAQTRTAAPARPERTPH